VFGQDPDPVCVSAAACHSSRIKIDRVDRSSATATLRKKTRAGNSDSRRPAPTESLMASIAATLLARTAKHAPHGAWLAAPELSG